MGSTSEGPGLTSSNAEPEEPSGPAAALERELYWAGPPVPDAATSGFVVADSDISQRWYELENTLLWEYTQRYPAGEDTLQVGGRFKRGIKRALFRLIRPLTRRYDRVGADIARLGFQSAQREAGHARELDALHADLELLTEEVRALRGRVWPPTAESAQPLQPVGDVVVRLDPAAAEDLRRLPWAWDDASVDSVVAIDVFSHLRGIDVPRWLDECWRILKPGGLLLMRLPAWNNPVSYRDPTNDRVFHEDTFSYWDPDHELHTLFGRHYFEGSSRWWKVRRVFRELDDLRFDLEKRA